MQSLKMKTWEELRKEDDSDERYPQVYFDHGAAEALMEGKKIDVGDEMILVARVRVSSKSEQKDGDTSISLEMLAGSIEAPEVSKEEKASKLYPSMNS
jgi:hypothetical protein